MTELPPPPPPPTGPVGPTGAAGPAGSVAAFAEDLSPDVVRYVTDVRAELLDLEPDELDEVLDDLVSHLREVRAGDDAPLETILGSPQAYAAELRASAGLAPVPPPPGPPGSGGDRTVTAADPFTAGVDQAQDLIRRVRVHPWWRAFVAFLPELRPAWWVLRGYLVVALVSAVTSSESFDGSLLLVPPVAGSTLAGLIALVAAVVWSVRWGRDGLTSPARGRRQVALWAAGGLAVLGAVAILGSSPAPDYVEVYAEPVPPWAVGASSAALNVYAFLPDGTPLDEVLLFDENGDPLVIAGGAGITDGDRVARSVETYSEELGQEVELVVPTDDQGEPVANLYPRDLYVFEDVDDGRMARRRLPPPDLADQLPRPTSTTTPTPVPTTSSAPPATSVPATAPASAADPVVTDTSGAESTTTAPVTTVAGSVPASGS